jgi:hypothetical protein
MLTALTVTLTTVPHTRLYGVVLRILIGIEHVNALIIFGCDPSQ